MAVDGYGYDSDAAKSIAEEVLEKGNEEQKKAAQEIIDQI